MTIVRDETEDELARMITPELRRRAVTAAFPEFGGLIRCAFQEGGVGPDADGGVACAALKEAISRVENRLRSLVQGRSSLEWLWILRRLPDALFKGTYATTVGYNRALAELISAHSARVGNPQIRNEAIYYRIHAGDVLPLLRFIVGVCVLTDLHVKYRWASKGARLTLGRDNRIHSSAPLALREAVRLYDERVEALTGPRGRGGSVVIEPLGPDDDEELILCVGGIDPVWCPVPGRIPGAGRNAEVFARYLPDRNRGSVAQVRALAADLPDQVVWSDEAETLIVLLRLALHYLGGHVSGASGLLQRGYLLANENFFEGHADDFVRYASAFICKHAPQVKVETGAQLLARFAALRPQSAWPLKAGPVLRRDGEVLCLDFASATHRLEVCLQYPASTGQVANVRSRHFENATQAIIDNSPWRPSDALRSMRQKALRRGGRNITDVDAIAEKDGTALLISCKSIIYSDLYDAGDHRTVRNAADVVEDAVQQWIEKVTVLTAGPGDNFDLSGVPKVVPLVCTPQVVYVGIGRATAEVLPGLRACAALGEVKAWVEGASRQVR